jgi:PAS domain S-box-containing protein
VRATVQASQEAVAVADASGRVLFANPSFIDLLGQPAASLIDIADIGRAFTDPQALAHGLDATRLGHQAWRSELEVAHPDGRAVPVGVRTEIVPGRDGAVLGCIVILTDLSNNRRADAARRHLEESLRKAGPRASGAGSAKGSDEVIGAILTNASLAAMDIADNLASPSVATLLEELEASTRRAAELYSHIRNLAGASTSPASDRAEPAHDAASGDDPA